MIECAIVRIVVVGLPSIMPVVAWFSVGFNVTE